MRLYSNPIDGISVASISTDNAITLLSTRTKTLLAIATLFLSGMAFAKSEINVQSVKEGIREDTKMLLQKEKSLKDSGENTDLKFKARLKLGRALLDSGNLAGAKESIAVAIDIVEKTNDVKNNKIIAYSVIADICSRESNFLEQSKYLDKGIIIARDVKNDFWIAKYTGDIGINFYMQGNFAQARKRFLEAISILNRTQQISVLFHKEEIRKIRMIFNLYLGEIEMDSGNFASAQNYLNEAVQLGFEMGNAEIHAKATSYLANIDQILGYNSLSRVKLLKSLKEAKENNLIPVILISNSLLMNLEIQAGRYPEAKRYADDNMVIGGLVGDKSVEAQAKSDLAYTTAKFDKNFEPSLIAVNESIELLRRQNFYSDLAIELNRRGEVFGELKNVPAAVDSYREAFNLAASRNLRCPLIEAANGLGDMLINRNVSEAKSYYRRALIEAKGSYFSCGAAKAELSLSKLFLKERNYSEAQKYAKSSLEIFKRSEDYAYQGKALEIMAEVAMLMGQESEARDLYKDSGIAYGLSNDLDEQIRVGEIIRRSEKEDKNKMKTYFILSISLLISLFVLHIGLKIFLKTHTSKNVNDGGVSEWYCFNESDTVFVFVHGIFSSSKTCWKSKNGTYWPELLKNDSRFSNPSIYNVNYYTAPDSGTFGVDDAADKLITELRSIDVDGKNPVLSKKNIIFVAHSTGGLVVRYLLYRYSEMFQSNRIGLVLVASPSRGSEWANRLNFLHAAFANRMGRQLERENDFIRALDKEFSDFVSQKRIRFLIGIDLFENHLISKWLKIFSSKVIVDPSNSGSFFGAYRIVQNTDHFTIAKPDSVRHSSHQYLWDFYSYGFLREVEKDN